MSNGNKMLYVFFVLVFIISLIPITHELKATPLPRGTGMDANIEAIADVLAYVVIRPGETWSFNATVGHPDKYRLVTYGGVYGGGWCDLASRYAELARKFGLEREFMLHSAPLNGVERQDNVSIWNEDGTGAQPQDLRITNNRMYNVEFVLLRKNTTYELIGSYSHPYFLRGSLFTLP